MAGTGSLLEISQVAAHAIGGDGRELAAGMALSAGNAHVRTRQRELSEIVIELRTLPRRRCVTRVALRRKIQAAVIRVGRLRKVRQVAAGAIRRSAGEMSVDMARRAQHADVCSGEAELGHVMVESRALPGGGVVTAAAIVRKACR